MMAVHPALKENYRRDNVRVYPFQERGLGVRLPVLIGSILDRSESVIREMTLEDETIYYKYQLLLEFRCPYHKKNKCRKKMVVGLLQHPIEHFKYGSTINVTFSKCDHVFVVYKDLNNYYLLKGMKSD
jgi:hypothetical protein